jgi:hypothetical protein
MREDCHIVTRAHIRFKVRFRPDGACPAVEKALRRKVAGNVLKSRDAESWGPKKCGPGQTRRLTGTAGALDL